MIKTQEKREVVNSIFIIFHKINFIIDFFHFRGLLMPMCRSPPFLSKNADKKEMEETYMPKEYYLYVNGQKVKVREQI